MRRQLGVVTVNLVLLTLIESASAQVDAPAPPEDPSVEGQADAPTEEAASAKPPPTVNPAEDTAEPDSGGDAPPPQTIANEPDEASSAAGESEDPSPASSPDTGSQGATSQPNALPEPDTAIDPEQEEALADLDLGELLNMRLDDTFVASKRKENLDGAPAVVTVIGAEELRRAGIRTVSEALQRVPGFYPTRQFFHDDLIGVRGYMFHTNDKIVLLMDGHNISRSGWTSVMTGDLDEVNSLEKVERIEIIHGPGSIVWGDNALFTAINIVTKKPSSAEGTTATVRYGRFAQGQTNTYVGNLQYGKQFTKDAGVLLNLNIPLVQGWVSKDYGAWFQNAPRGDYNVDNFDGEFQSYEFYGKAEVHDWRIWFRAMNPHQNSAMAQYPTENAEDLSWRPYQDDEDFSLQNYTMVAEKDIKATEDLNLHMKVGFDKYIFNGAFSFGPGQFGCTDPVGDPDACTPGPGGPGPLFYMHQDNSTLSSSFSGSYTGLKGHTILAGIDYVHGQYGDSRAVPVLPDDPADGQGAIRSPGGAEYTSAVWVPGSDNTIGAYLQEQWRIIDHLEAFAGTRVEWNQPRSDGRFVFSPRGGIITRPFGDDYALLKYSFNTGYRRANWWQARWPLGLFGNYFGLVVDGPEFSHNHDIQAIWNITEQIKLNAVYWIMSANHMIFAANTAAQATGQTNNWVNAGDFKSDGLEFKFDYQFMRSNVAGFNATWTRKATFDVKVDGFDEESFLNADGRFLDYPEFQGTVFTNLLFDSGVFTDLNLRYMHKIPGRLPVDDVGNVGFIEPGVNQEVVVKHIFYTDVAVGARDLGLDGLAVTLRGLNVLNNRKRIPRGQGDHDLYQPPPAYGELQVAYTY